MRRSVGQGCTIMAAWTPAKAPRSSMSTLPPPPSSAGRAEDAHGQSELVGHGRQGEPGADGGRRDDVVAAGVAHAGQRVVFGAHRHHQLAVARP